MRHRALPTAAAALALVFLPTTVFAQANEGHLASGAAILFVPEHWTFGNRAAAIIVQDSALPKMMIAVRNDHPSAALVRRAVRTLMLVNSLGTAASSSRPPRSDRLRVFGVDEKAGDHDAANVPEIREAIQDLQKDRKLEFPGFGKVHSGSIPFAAMGRVSAHP